MNMDDMSIKNLLEASKPKLIYLASPYSHPYQPIMEGRYKSVCLHTAILMRRGLMIFSPISHGHGPAQFGLPTDFKYWESYCEATLLACGELFVLMLDGWKDSIGVQAEIKMAVDNDMEITYIDPEENLNE